MSTPENKSYLAAGLNAISPWGSRSTTPKSTPAPGPKEPVLGQQQGGDHVVSHSHRLSLRKYPKDCPRLDVRWYYAVDVPKRKPQLLDQKESKGTKPAPPPKKFVPFSIHDSKAIEVTFQKLAEEEDDQSVVFPGADAGDLGTTPGKQGARNENTSLDDGGIEERAAKAKVAVHEDYLFDVDVEQRELAPAYWLGPIYEVRRGTWFYQEGSSLRPCDENLATQLEEGYLRVKPWQAAQQSNLPMSTPNRSRSSSLMASIEGQNARSAPSSRFVTPKPSSENLKVPSGEVDPDLANSKGASPAPANQLHTHRLFGTYMNSVVTYQDDRTAWLLSDDFMSRMSSSMYQRFAGGGHLGGVKVIRGYSEPGKVKELKDSKSPKQDMTPPQNGTPATKGTVLAEDIDLKESAPQLEALKCRSAPPDIQAEHLAPGPPEPASKPQRQALERRVSSFVETNEPEDPEKAEEEVRKLDEKEIRDDYRDTDGEEQGREIGHLLLVTHGIGQRLGLRLESVNFVHDVNVLRKTLKAVYSSSADLQALNNELEKLPKNCRVQVLPVCWRHLLDFPKQGLKNNRKEHDLGDADDFGDEEEYPSLADITVEGVPAVRSLITDLALDILLYQSAYKGHISGIVLRECNRIYKLFLERNPNFNGKVSLVGHSLGSAIMFDILCRQKEEKHLRAQARQRHVSMRDHPQQELQLNFEVENFFCLGSPIGLFQMLRGRTIAARQSSNFAPAETPTDSEEVEDPFLSAPLYSGTTDTKWSETTLLPVTISSPKCNQLFNIFHPTDPISYRIEPLISPAMASLKPQPLPYTKRGIFGAPIGQGLTGIGARVGQSVSGFWSSLSTGIASSLLNRSLGITGDEAKDTSSASSSRNSPSVPLSRVPLSAAAGTNSIGGGVIPAENVQSSLEEVMEDDRKRRLAEGALYVDPAVDHPPTLIDSEIETLYSGFQKRRKSHQSEHGIDPSWQEAEEKGRKLRREESKVRALNSNGRVDFSIQEGVFDISLIASIASHLSYWGDEDVTHFMLSQLLSGPRHLRR
ncbi:DDHD-domain-containing protein [Xylona heveae TC161]|uniref:DDHD-domain-containing protein n=1 Tax=Xylona heveae (strain CBS 132557 / TC161) TaxID=1328760 RepID=A0A165A9F3_XYLHT|nr:DDHD-domain-containing protein [Xylona heveae TC161]KZF20128.1 DDHD-domain-containing protein [Xylona heveae TC161]